jgi:hypothetical protein
VFTSLLRGPRASPRYLAPRITPEKGKEGKEKKKKEKGKKDKET